MATITRSWSSVTTLVTGGTLATDASTDNDILLASTGADLVEVQTDITIGSSGGLTVSFYGGLTSGGTDDTNALLSYTVSGSEVRTVQFVGKPFVKCTITNDTAGGTSGAITQQYRYSTWQSA